MLLMLCMGAGKVAYAQTTITPPMLKAGGSTSGAKSYQFKVTGDAILTAPISVSKAGKVCLEATTDNNLLMVLSKNSDVMRQDAWIGAGYPNSSAKETVSGYAKKAGAYYMHVIIPKGTAQDQAALNIKAYEIPAAVGNAGTLSNGKWVTTSGVGSIYTGEPAYFKIKAPSSGLCQIGNQKIR